MATIPLIAITRILTPGGQAEVAIDGRQVRPAPGESADQAALRDAARLAARAPERLVHADMTDEHGATWRVAIHGDGTVVALPHEDEDPAPTQADWPDESAPGPVTPPPIRRPDTRTGGATARAAARNYASKWLRTLTRRGLPSWTPIAVVVAAGLVAVGALAFALTHLNVGNAADPTTGSSVAVASGGELPQSPPLEWRRDALWSSPALMPEAAKVAVVDGDKVGMVTADRRVALVGAAGQTRWSVNLPEGRVHSPLNLTYMGATRVLAIHVGSRLVWWSVDDPSVTGGVDLPGEQTPITWRGDTPLVGISQAQVAIVQGGQLAQVSVPQGAKAVSGWADGHVVAGSSTGWWRLRPGAAPGQATPWETPEDKPDQLNIIDGMGAYVVAVRSVGNQVHVVVHVDDGKKITRLFSDVLPGVRVGEALTWRPSSSRSWGILGHAIVDMERANSTDLGTPWTTGHIIADRAMGTLGREKVVVSPDAPRGVMRPDESFPEEVLGRNALVRGRDEQGAEHVWLLPPNPDVATVQPSSRPSRG